MLDQFLWGIRHVTVTFLVSLLTVGQLTKANIRDSIHCPHYLGNSHSRDGIGNPSSNGASVLVSF